jgi:hypothetical protein
LRADSASSSVATTCPPSVNCQLLRAVRVPHAEVDRRARSRCDLLHGHPAHARAGRALALGAAAPAFGNGLTAEEEARVLQQSLVHRRATAPAVIRHQLRLELRVE